MAREEWGCPPSISLIIHSPRREPEDMDHRAKIKRVEE
jgi:hypothetical protein